MTTASLINALITMALSGGFALLGYWMGFRAGSRTTPDRCRAARQRRQEIRQ